MSARDIVLGAASGGAATPTYVDDVFSTYLYTGNGSTQTINNGIDLAGKGGLVWIKNRNNPNALSRTNNRLIDTERGNDVAITTNNVNGNSSGFSTYFNFSSSGFSYPTSLDSFNYLNDSFVAWTFRKAAKFFDVVTYTGNGVAGRQIAHSLGVAPGMVIVKRTSSSSNWAVYHSSVGNGSNLLLNTTDASSVDSTVFNNTSPASTVFTVGTSALTNASGSTYVAYLFAHDTSADGIIQCGSYVGTGSTTTINLGWEPQYVMIKKAIDPALNGVSPWIVMDNMRGLGTPYDNALCPNTSTSEAGDVSVSGALQLTATGFQLLNANGALNVNTDTYIYMAIRRPNKPPTSGTQVFSPVYEDSTTPAVQTPFVVDMGISKRHDLEAHVLIGSRLQGSNKMYPAYSDVQGFDPVYKWDYQNGYKTNAGLPTGLSINWAFKRAPGFFDAVCYTGNYAGNPQIAHNFTVAPELLITKVISASGAWYINSPLIGTNYQLAFNASAKSASSTYTLTSTYFQNPDINYPTGGTFIAYLFATLAGISKVGSYTGNGSSQNIECGFAAGARFILIKRTDATGDWYVWDTTRGIAAANDPHLSLNAPWPQVTTDDSVDPYSAGFAVNQVAATNINVTSATYIFLAIA